MENNIAKIAVSICSDEAFKKALLTEEFNSDSVQKNYQKWNEKVEEEARHLLGLEDVLKQDENKVLHFVFSIALRMLTWTEYHIRTFGLSRDFCIDFLDNTVFTDEGIFDYEEISHKILNSQFSSKQGFLLSCYYCHKERVEDFFSIMTEEEKATVYNAQNPDKIEKLDLYEYWYYATKGEIETLIANKIPSKKAKARKIELDPDTFDHYGAMCAIKCGSRVATEYFLKNVKDPFAVLKTDLGKCLVILRAQLLQTKCTNDWIVFTKSKYNPSTVTGTSDCWIPDTFLVDTFYYILSRLTEIQKSHVISLVYLGYRSFDLIPGLEHVGDVLHDFVFDVLHFFLCCPYQNQFVELLKVSWMYIPPVAYANLLKQIVIRIIPGECHYWVGENKFYDYRKFLEEVWTPSPESFKEYIFFSESREIKFGVFGFKLRREAIDFLLMLCKDAATNEKTRELVKVILSTVKPTLRERFIISDEGKELCYHLVREKHSGYLKELVEFCCESAAKAQYNKIFLKNDCTSCFNAVLNEDWEEAARSLKLSGIQDEDLILKRHIIEEAIGKDFCRHLCLINVDLADRFISWCLENEKSAEDFKKALLCERDGIKMCEGYVFSNRFDEANRLVDWAMPSKFHKQQYRKMIVTYNAKNICNNFDITYASEVMARSPPASIAYIVDWSKIGILFKWCHETDEAIEAHKKDIVLDYGDDIITLFVADNKCAEADKFLSFLPLSPDGVKEYKKQLFFLHYRTGIVFSKLQSRDEKDSRFESGKEKAVVLENFLKWFLADEEAIMKFMESYKTVYDYNSLIKNTIDNLKDSYESQFTDQNA